MINRYWKTFPPLQILEIYGDHADEFCKKISAIPNKYVIKERKHYSQGPFDVELSNYDAVLINDTPVEVRNDILKACFAIDKRVYFVPKLSDIIVKGSDNLNVIDTPLYLCRNKGPSVFKLIVKRVFDVVASLAALILLSPIFLFTAIAIKLEDHAR